MNPMEFTMTRRISWPWGDFSSSTPTPEIRETYPGTSGSTHGDKNEISPATKAARGSGRLDIGSYCTCWRLLVQRLPLHKTRPLAFSCKHGGRAALQRRENGLKINAGFSPGAHSLIDGGLFRRPL